MREKERLKDEIARLQNRLSLAEGATDRMRDQRDDALAEARIWRVNYNRAIEIGAIFAPPDLLQALDEITFDGLTR